ncbi:MAG: phage baseplate assembly protein [Caulobacteraceae bacterium]
MASEDLVLYVGGNKLTGWTDISLTRGVERCPNDFQISLSELAPSDAHAVEIEAGAPCTVSLGDDVVITGYVDRYAPFMRPTATGITVSGRGRCQDLVDCSADWPGGQIKGQNILEVATKLAEPFGIAVSCSVDPGPVIPQFNLMRGETPWDIIERYCRAAALLCFEDADGNLVLDLEGSETHASGVKQGRNVEMATTTMAMDERFSEYDVFFLATEPVGIDGGGADLVGKSTDPNVKRYRPHYAVAETGFGGPDIAQKRAHWEAARRQARGFCANVTVDSWRDSAGKLWTPNTRVPIDLPYLKAADDVWILGEVTYRRDGTGTHADLTLMKPGAYTPEPILLIPEFRGITPGPAAPATGGNI